MLKGLRQRLPQVTNGDGFKARLVRSALGSAGIQATNRLLTLGLGVLLARALGAEGYGVYSYAITVMTLLMVAAEAGVPTLLMREVAASDDRGDWGLLRGALRGAGQFVALTSTMILLLGLLVLWLVAGEVTPTVLTTTLIMLFVLPLSAGANTAVFAIRGLNRIVLGQAVDMLLRPIMLLALVGGVFWFLPDLRLPQTVMAAQLLAALATLVLGVIVLRCLTPAAVSNAHPIYRRREWLRSAVPFTLIGSAGIISTHTDIIMLGWFAGSEEVGIYRVAVQGATLVGFSLQVINAVVAPQFSRLYAQSNMAHMQVIATQSARAVLLLAVPIALLLILAGGVLLGWIFGAEFISARAPLAILAVGQLVNAAFGSVGFLLNMTGHEAVNARILWQSALLNILLNVVLIPIFGMNGAAVATAMSLAFWNVSLYRQVKNRLGIISTAFYLETK